MIMVLEQWYVLTKDIGFWWKVDGLESMEDVMESQWQWVDGFICAWMVNLLDTHFFWSGSLVYYWDLVHLGNATLKVWVTVKLF